MDNTINISIHYVSVIVIVLFHSVTIINSNLNQEATTEALKRTRKTVEVGHEHLFNFTPITGRGIPRHWDDLEKPKFCNGKPVPIVEHPYVASILRNGNMVGVGTIVSDLWVLTSAYNALYSKKQYLRIRVGSSSPYVFGRNYFVKGRAIYPRFNYTWLYSLGMLKTEDRMEPNKYIQILSVGDYFKPPHIPVKVIGFGTNSKHWQVLTEERKVYIATYDYCVDRFADAEDMDNPMMFCVPDTRYGPCQYNIGAPVISLDKPRIVGLYLGTHKCNSNESYGAYIDVTRFKRWIENVAFMPHGVTPSGGDYRSEDWPKEVHIDGSSSSGWYGSRSSSGLGLNGPKTASEPSQEDYDKEDDGRIQSHIVSDLF